MVNKDYLFREFLSVIPPSKSTFFFGGFTLRCCLFKNKKQKSKQTGILVKKEKGRPNRTVAR